MNAELRAALAGAIGGAITVFVLLLIAVFTHVLPAVSPDNRIRDFLVTHPQILVAMSDRLQEQQEQSADAARQAAVRKIGIQAFFDPHVAFVMGNPRARTTFVEFFDYNCPYCRASLPTVKEFIGKHKTDARFAFIEFPIKGQESVAAARAAIAARKQPDKYLDFHLRMMGEKDLVTEDTVYADAAKAGLDVARLKADMSDPSVDAAIASAHNLASAVGIDGTPAFIIDGRTREGAIDKKLLADLLKGA
jgi:protein-disulfide isomerase